jgi:hypothetical protein
MTVQLVGGCPTLQHLPIGSLKGFGTNPYGEPIFRVVWSESRYYLVGASHVEYDGDPANDRKLKQQGRDPNIVRRTVGYKWLPLYPGQPRWIMEMWKSPIGFTGCTKEQWDIYYRDPISNLSTLGPYPERGEYAECSGYPLSKIPTRDEIVRFIYFVKAGWNYNFAQKKQANDEALAKKEKDKFNQFEAQFKDAQQAFNNRPSNIRPGKRTSDQYRIGGSRPNLAPGFSTSREGA